MPRPKAACGPKINSNSPGTKDHLVRKRSPVRIRAWAPSSSLEYKSPAFVLQSLPRRSLSFVWGNRCSIVAPNATAELRNDLVIQDNGVVQQSRGNTGSLVWAGLCSRLPVDSVGSRDPHSRTAEPGVRGVLHHCRIADATGRVGFAVPAKSEARRRLGGNRRLAQLPHPSR